jgi:talin
LCSLKEFLPQSYAKVKGIEKKVFTEQKKHFGLSELDAKVQYTKTARSLKTYGVTFFLVKVLYQEMDNSGFGWEVEAS